MPRSSRHKSSKHNSRDARDHSDSEKESTLRERKSREVSGATVSKESGSGDKRKLDTKDNKVHYDSLNGEYYEEPTSPKRHKEKVEDSANDRWNGGDDDIGETSKKSKTSGEKRRRDEIEGEDTKKSSCKADGKYRESSRRKSKEFEKERHREKDREGKTHKIAPGETGLKAQDQLQRPGSENYPEKRSRLKREDHSIRHKHQDNIGDASDRVFTSGDDCLSDGNQKEEKCRDKKYRDKNRVDTEEANKHRGNKQGDDRPDKEHPTSDGKDVSERKRKKTKLQENDHDKEYGHELDSEVDGSHNRPCEYECNQDYEREYDRGGDRDERDHDRGRDRDHDFDSRDYERDRYLERDWERGQSRDRDWDHDRDRTRDREKDRSRDYYHDRGRSKTENERKSDCDVSYLDQTGRYKDCRERRSPDDLSDSKSRIITAHTDIDTRGSRGQPDGDRTRSQRQPSSSLAQEEIGNILDQKPQGLSSRETADLSGGSERGSKNRVSENTAKMEDDSLGEFQVERSSSTKASPQPLVERSPSAMGLERRYINHTGTSLSLEVEETSQRNNTRDFQASEADRILVDETSKAELSFNIKANQNKSSFPPRPESRGGISSPKVGPLEEDSRASIAGRYKRGGDANMGRGQQGNVWRGSPNWPSPVIPNGFIPFQHGPPHGGFQSMMPQFPSPSLFGVRPSMEMSHSGIPYHMTDAERFSGHLLPHGWQNMMDVSGPHMHGFFEDMSNGVFRDESRMYGGAEWDHSRRVQGRAWDSGADAWKTQNGNGSMDVSSMSVKDDHLAQALDCDTLAVDTNHFENSRAKSVEARSNLTSLAKDLAVSSPKIVLEEAYVERYCRHYLSKLDISVKLTDAELHSQCMGSLKGEEDPTSDDGIAVFVNLKEGGKAVPRSHYSSLTSLIPIENISVFQIAMELYKEQRYEMNGLPDVKYEGPQVSSSDMEVNDRILKIGESNPAKKKQKAALPEPEREEEEERGSSPNRGNSCEAQEDEEDGSGVIVGDKCIVKVISY